MSLTGSDAQVLQGQRFQGLYLLMAMLANKAAITFDEIECTYNASSDVFTLKNSGSGAATFTVTYTDSTKERVQDITQS